MRAVTWNGRYEVQVDTVPDPILLNPRDAIIQITSTCICGSDLHLYNGVIPTMLRGDILGHEFMGRVVEVGHEVRNLQVGDRVIVPFNIACGACEHCHRQEWSLCDNSNPYASIAEGMYGFSPAGLFGYTHMYGAYAGGQAELVRVPFADVGPFKVPDNVPDEQAVLMTDVFPTAYQAALYAGIKPGDVVAVWGCGPVGLLTQMVAYHMGAARVYAIDHIPDRLEMAYNVCKSEAINYEGVDVVEALKEMTGGRGPDACIDAVGLESHGAHLDSLMDRAMQLTGMATDRPHVLREAIQACGKGGTLSIPGVYGGFLDKVPFGAAFGKGLTFRMGQTHVHKYLPELLEWIQTGKMDPSFIITHKMTLEEAPRAYEIFRHREDQCVKVILKP